MSEMEREEDEWNGEKKMREMERRRWEKWRAEDEWRREEDVRNGEKKMSEMEREEGERNGERRIR